jgi:hypothetical protein
MEIFEDVIQDLDVLEEIKNEVIINRLGTHSNYLDGQYIYSLRINKSLNRQNYHHFSLDHFKKMTRKLTNGQNILGGLSNREFWRNNFIGGVRNIGITQIHEEYPIFENRFILFSRCDNLDVRVMKNLKVRIKLIDPSLDVEFHYIGVYSMDSVTQYLNSTINVNYESGMFEKLNSDLKKEIVNSYYQKPKFLGVLSRKVITDEQLAQSN